MTYSHQEAAANAAKEIMLGLIASGKSLLLVKGGKSPEGTDLAAHVGDCFEALLKKVKNALQGT
jgi:hypothetical protein